MTVARRILTRTLAVERRRAFGWMAGIALLVGVTTGTWPAIKDSTQQFSEVLQNMPPALTAFLGQGIADFSAAGLIGSRLFGTIGLAVFIGFAVSRGAGAIAGEEEEGTLEQLVTQPVSRTWVATARVTAAWTMLAALLLLQMVLLLVMMPIVGLDFAVPHVLGATIGLFLLASVFGSLAFAVGAATGRRGACVGVGAGAAAGMFILTGLGGLVSELQGLADLSPFSHYDGTVVLDQGLDIPAAATFLVVSVLLVAAGIVAFNRRDLS